MEVYELPITPEESKNYHSFFYKLKALTLREWMRSYITAVIYAVVLCGVIYFISDTLFIRFWFDTPLAGKGVLAAGMDADLCVFDPEALRETGTYQEPCRMAAGMDTVLAAGVPVLEQGVLTGARPGRIIRR